MRIFAERYITRKEHEQIVLREKAISYSAGKIICGIYVLGGISILMLSVVVWAWQGK
jgi:hypothetical protein